MAKKLRLSDLEPVVNYTALFRCAEKWSLDSAWAKSLHDYDLWYVLGGRGCMTTSEEKIDLYPGQAVWMRPGHRYEATHDPAMPLRVVAIHFQLKSKSRLLRCSEFTPPVEVFQPEDPDYFGAAVAHIVSLQIQPGASMMSALLLKSILLEIVAHSAVTKIENPLDRHHKRMLSPIIAFLRDQPEKRFTVVELAAKTGYSSDHFVRLFRSITGESPKEFMIRVRMARARALLRESSHTITQIAEQLGYQDLGFFSRQFKVHVGVSPDRFRRDLCSLPALRRLR